MGRRQRTNYESGDWLAALLERDGVPVFKIWTAIAGSDLGTIQADVPTWGIPSLALVRGTRLGAADFMAYFPSDGRLRLRDGKVVRIPREEWLPMRMEDQVDAILYLGRTLTFSPLPRELCSDEAYLGMRFKRLALTPEGPGDIARLKQYCGKGADRAVGSTDAPQFSVGSRSIESMMSSWYESKTGTPAVVHHAPAFHTI